MNKERMKRAFMVKIIAALLIIYLLAAGCTTYYSAEAKFEDGKKYTCQVMGRLSEELSSCGTEEKSRAAADGMNLAMAAYNMEKYDSQLGVWDGARRIDTIMLYREEQGADNKEAGLKPVQAPDVHFLREFSTTPHQPMLILEDWLSPAHVGYFLRMDALQCIVKGYEKNGFIEPVTIWAGRWEDVEPECWKKTYAHELTPVKKASGEKTREFCMENTEIGSVNWQQKQDRDESWELLESIAADFKVDRDEEETAGLTIVYEEAAYNLFTSRHTGFIQLRQTDYWLGYCVISHPLLSAIRDNLWMEFLLAVVCLMVGLLLISSYFRVLDEQYETELRRRNMSDAMAHEMKTPLGIIKNYSEALMEEENPEMRNQYLDTIIEETDDMNRMIVQLLDLSKMEAGTYPLRLSMLSVNRIIEGILKRTEILMKPKKLQVETDLHEETLILADEKLLTESISNLVLNAVRYSEEGSAIKILLRYEEKEARISVENRGPQIAEKDKSRIWESFYRGDEARSRESGGNGLGLSIAANTCALHRGTCGFENLEHGVKFWLKIPSQENRPREKKSAAGPLLYREKAGLDLTGLRYILTGTILWLIPYAVIFLAWRHDRPGASDMLPYVLSLPGWLLSWTGAWKMRSAGSSAAMVLWTIPAVLAAGIPLCIGSEDVWLALCGGRKLLLLVMSFYFAAVTLVCRKTVHQFGNLKLRKLVRISGAAEVIFLALCVLVVGINQNLAENSILALASMGAVFNVCLWYDIYRRYHLRAEKNNNMENL